MTDREKIAARIRALLAKTVENGCTEDEAVSAAAKAAEMLARYNLTVDEVQMRATPFERHTSRHEDAVADRLWKPASAIAVLTGAKQWTSAAGVWPIEITFFGFEHEVQTAHYLLAICTRAMQQQMDRQTAVYALLRPEVRRRKVGAFLDGMADRLRERILDLVPPPVTGTGLIVLRDQLILDEMDRQGLEIRQARKPSSDRFDENYGDGRRAADKVALNAGVESERDRPLQLARGSVRG